MYTSTRRGQIGKRQIEIKFTKRNKKNYLNFEKTICNFFFFKLQVFVYFISFIKRRYEIV